MAILIVCLFLIGTGSEGVPLPVDPSLVGESPKVPDLPSLKKDLLTVGASRTKSASVVIAEGIPPVLTKILEKVRRWEYIDLSTLLHDPSHKSEDLIQQDSQVFVFQTMEQAQKRKKQIKDFSSWVQAFSILMATLASAEGTSNRPDQPPLLN